MEANRTMTSSSPAPARMLTDVVVMTRRNLYAHLRMPALIATATALPIMWVLLFNFVFGGALQPADVEYIDFLVPGVMVLAVTFNLNNAAVGVAEDLSQGMIHRFRSLPMTRWALLAGRAVFDTVRNLLAVLVVIGVGALCGFRFHNGAGAAVASVALALAFGVAMSWLGAFIGLLARGVETASMTSLLLAIPTVFVASLFVPVASMPGWLQAVARVNPVTPAVDATRALVLGGPVARPVILTLAWTVGLLAVLIPLTVVRYRRIRA
jgi:ABC-2 type transport system permease protein/oleandomycin transport system permease protein